MRAGTRLRGATVLAAAAVVAVSGCSTKAPESSGGGGGGSEGGDVTTDVGVEGTTIRLGVLTDFTGVFAALGTDITNGNTLYWEDNQVCDTYDVELEVQDTGYVPQTGVQLYSAMEPNVLAMQQTIGSPINTALAGDYESDSIVNFPSAWARTLTEIPGTGVLGATYDVEIANGYQYLFDQGLLQDGATVGHIYFEGEYGENGLAGSRAVAEARGLNLVEAQIKSTDQDMSAQVTQFAAEGVEAIVLTVAPGQTASVAAVAQSAGLDVPILGSNPVFAPGLLDGPSAQWLKDHLYVAAPFSSWAAQPELLEQYQAAYPGTTPSPGGIFGYAMGEVMNQVLDAACESGDLTREGVITAFNELTDVDTGGLIVPIDAFETGVSPSTQSFIVRPADVPGGAEVVQEAFEGELAADLAG
ncbi:ABC-type branched-chain amino acid transport system, substrate-binding protein [Geodermatophilus aquaeductus]|uniref:ABC-type branched-chain amino acid transport system, substrate-binding protein n=1 Tax=Geodermatophilus aquaeductus TaxID=1564161 RepID=A0A521E7J5_9ACTN|nr:ABC transporter substrate-binding protein [Geodermatophilus aquaeductus]SMO79150.1 ABC-type branched-chain amino acid transport system, substrate-binding protein [Geodermatophilus aquaeductus]